jgi:putative tricarboxylic transport membrane protein
VTFDRGVAVGLFFFASAMLYSAVSMPRPLVRQIVGPEVLPILLMGLLAVASVALFIRNGPIKVSNSAPKGELAKLLETESIKVDHKTQALVVLGIAVYIVLFESLGYVISTALLCIYETAVFEAKHWVRNVLVGAGFSVAVYLLFVHILNVGLPKGVLGW